MLTSHQWLSESFERQELAVMNIPLAMELYAKYRETELSRPPKDVVEAIEKKYPISLVLCQNIDGSPAQRDANDELRTAALHGYSLASGEAVAFGNWIMKSGYIEHNAGDAEWTKKWVLYTSDIDQEYVTTEQLYELFKKERNGLA